MINKVILIGRVGKFPELKATKTGVPVCQLSIATSEKYKDKSGEMREITEWHTVIAWQKLAEICSKYLDKGLLVYVEGKIQSRQYDKDGVKLTIKEIVASDVRLLERKKEVEQKPIDSKEQTAQQPNQEQYTSEDIPF